jgi:hypothetical protein
LMPTGLRMARTNGELTTPLSDASKNRRGVKTNHLIPDKHRQKHEVRDAWSSSDEMHIKKGCHFRIAVERLFYVLQHDEDRTSHKDKEVEQAMLATRSKKLVIRFKTTRSPRRSRCEDRRQRADQRGRRRSDRRRGSRASLDADTGISTPMQTASRMAYKSESCHPMSHIRSVA